MGRLEFVYGARMRARVRPADLGLAGLLALTSLAEVTLTEVDTARPAVTAGMGVAVAAAMLLRSVSPVSCLAVATALVLVSEAEVAGLTLTGTAVVGLLVALATVGRHCPDPTSIGAAVGSTSAFVVSAAFHGRPWDVVIVLLACGAAWQAGRLLRREAERSGRLHALAEELATERDARARQAVEAERLRIAREVHDTVAHTVSVMTIQVGGVRRRLDADPGRVAERDVLLAVESLGRDAVGELHGVLGMLRDRTGGRPRDDGAEVTGPPAPQPRLADLEELALRFRASGVTVSLRVDGTPQPASAGVELVAYRVVQEALTNVLKHGAEQARVTVRYDGERLRLLIEDDGSEGRPGGEGTGTGLGIIGIRERVALYGGEAEAGPLPGGGFAVRADLPLHTEVGA